MCSTWWRDAIGDWTKEAKWSFCESEAGLWKHATALADVENSSLRCAGAERSVCEKGAGKDLFLQTWVERRGAGQGWEGEKGSSTTGACLIDLALGAGVGGAKAGGGERRRRSFAARRVSE